MLDIDDLHAGYGSSTVLRGVSLRIGAGECVALLGRNGSGRSTLLKSIMGMLNPTAGDIRFNNRSIAGQPVHAIARLGIGYVPEGRDVFPHLTVAQNLLLGLKPGISLHTNDPRTIAERFPALLSRLTTPAGVLSGGEQQMLAIARALAGQPSLLLVDEPTEGLAPDRMTEIALILRTLHREGMTLLLVEQKMKIALELADRVIILGQGRVVFDDTTNAFIADSAARRRWLAIDDAE